MNREEMTGMSVQVAVDLLKHLDSELRRLSSEIKTLRQENAALRAINDQYMQDMVAKKRSFVGRGENKKGRAKLTNQQADQVKKMEMSQSKIAALFGVSQTTIGRIKRGESY